MTSGAELSLGASPNAQGTRFSTWTTAANAVEVRLFADVHRALRTVPLEPQGNGLHTAQVAGVPSGALYKFVLDGVEQVDPYARFLPFGVDGPAEVIAAVEPSEVAPRRAPSLAQLVIYEVHVGTFTPAGTFRAAIEHLPALAALGVTAIELMPLSSFPGARGWGYDGVAHFAPFAGYGRPEELRALVRSAHDLGLRVLLDVVYNHFGPSGNALWAYSTKYFSEERKTPWGAGPDFSHPRMRGYVLANARYWLEQFGFDGLRLDATHEIQDVSVLHILRELRDEVARLDPPRLLIAEDERNEPALLLETGLDAVWADDFHHQVQVLLAGDRDGYYAAYQPTLAALAHTIVQGWTYSGEVYPPWNRPRGKPAAAVRFEQLVYCLQNHDQIGNRALGTRLSQDAPVEAVHLATALLLFLPSTPMLFMGQEWSASTPFLYFADHAGELGRQVSEGRRKEFAKFEAFSSAELRARIPDPQDPTTFERSKLHWEERDQEPHRQTLQLVTALLRLRREDPVLSSPCRRGDLSVAVTDGLLGVHRKGPNGARTLMANFSQRAASVPTASSFGQPLFTIGGFESGSLAAWGAVIVDS